MSASELVKEVIKEVFFLIGKGKRDEALIQLDRALYITKEISSEYLRPYILNEIAQAFFKLDKTKEALHIVQEAISIADQIVFLTSRFDILLKLAKSLSEISVEIKNSQILQKTLEIAKVILTNVLDISYRDIANEVAVILRNIVRTTDDLKIIREIIEISKQFEDKYYRSMLMRNISFRLAELCKNKTDTSYIKGILKLVDLIEQKNYRAKTIGGIVRFLTKTAENTKNQDIIQIALDASNKMSSEYYRSKIKSKLLILKEEVGNL